MHWPLISTRWNYGKVTTCNFPTPQKPNCQTNISNWNLNDSNKSKINKISLKYNFSWQANFKIRARLSYTVERSYLCNSIEAQVSLKDFSKMKSVLWSLYRTYNSLEMVGYWLWALLSIQLKNKFLNLKHVWRNGHRETANTNTKSIYLLTSFIRLWIL